MSVPINHVYEINVAKSNFRETYNAGNGDRLLTAFADEFTNMTAGAPSFFGADAKVCASVAHDEASRAISRYSYCHCHSHSRVQQYGF